MKGIKLYFFIYKGKNTSRKLQKSIQSYSLNTEMKLKYSIYLFLLGLVLVDLKDLPNFIENSPSFNYSGTVLSLKVNNQGPSPFNSFPDIFHSGACMTAYVRKSASLFNFTLACNADYEDLQDVEFEETEDNWSLDPYTLTVRQEVYATTGTKLFLVGGREKVMGRIILWNGKEKAHIMRDKVFSSNSCVCHYRNEFLIHYKRPFDHHQMHQSQTTLEYYSYVTVKIVVTGFAVFLIIWFVVHLYRL